MSKWRNNDWKRGSAMQGMTHVALRRDVAKQFPQFDLIFLIRFFIKKKMNRSETCLSDLVKRVFYPWLGIP